jgi:hypothetical protein
MSEERELLWRIQQVLQCERDDYGFVGEIENLLAQPEQEPVVKITSIHADGENLPVAITGVVLSDAVNIWDLPIKNNELLFLAPQKQEPLSEDEIFDIGYKAGFAIDQDYEVDNYGFLNGDGYVDNEPYFKLVRAIEKAHGITGGEE